MMKDPSQNILSKSKLDHPVCTLNEKIEQNLKEFTLLSQKYDTQTELSLEEIPLMEDVYQDTGNSNKNCRMKSFICRTCLTTGKNRIYTKITSICKDSVTIRTALSWVTPKLKVQLNREDRICDRCLQILKSIVTFIFTCLKSDAKLSKGLGNVTQAGTSENKEGSIENDTTENDTIENDTIENDTIENILENLIDTESSSLNENTSKPEYQDPSILKEIEYWNKCRKDCSLGNQITNKILADYGFNKVSNHDFVLKDHEKIVSVGSLHCSFPDVVNSLKFDLKENVEVINYSDPWQQSDRRRVILLGSKLYQNCPVCNDTFSSESLLEAHFDDEHSDVSKAYLIKSYQNIVSRDHMKCDICEKHYHIFKKLQKHSQGCLLLKCPYCKILFPEIAISNHIRETHFKDFSIKCYKCQKNVNSFLSFQIHDCTKTTKRKTRMCMYCKQCIPVKEYTLHVNSAHMVHACSICDQQFPTKRSLNDHYQRHRTELCSICGILFSKAYYRKHMRLVHKEASNKESPGFSCPTCNNTFSTHHHLRRHIEHIHNKSYFCDICGITCQEKHLRDHHRSLDCSTCQKSFQTQGKLKGHMQRNHKKPYAICEICGLKCQAHNLKTHMRTVHSERKQHVCEICDRGFSRKDYLEKHMMQHYSKNRIGATEIAKNGKIRMLPGWLPNERFSCKFCLKKFKYVCQLRTHMNRHMHLARHKCRYCYMTFANFTSRHQHEKRHKEKNYKFRCNGCWKHFSNQEELDEHESLKHIKKFQCEYCDKSFSRKFEYMSHLVEVHVEMETILKERENVILESVSLGQVDDDIAEMVEIVDNLSTVESTDNLCTVENTIN